LIVLACTEFTPEHWRRIRSNIGIERIGREFRRRTRVAGTFPDCHSALMLVTARLKYIVEHEWGKRMYLDMSKL
jgi:putative transposase